MLQIKREHVLLRNLFSQAYHLSSTDERSGFGSPKLDLQIVIIISTIHWMFVVGFRTHYGFLKLIF